MSQGEGTGIEEPVDTVQHDFDYEPGEHNIAWLGLDVHHPVFGTSAFVALFSAAFVLSFPDLASGLLLDMRNSLMAGFDWFFSASAAVIIVFVLGVAVSPYGRICLGGSEARPDFGFLSWISMLFSAGVGIGMTFTALPSHWPIIPVGMARRLMWRPIHRRRKISPWARLCLIGGWCRGQFMHWSVWALPFSPIIPACL